ncbi:prolyl oligopeptidase family serine peptidase [Streptomyces albiaxialis]|uniref:Prolyl oligopeptidase family serine peptidase n=1 Tax=Streptomyces albiaxialis TaxID=329523 RepID=A0ABN2W9S4_9ACTN
MPMFPMDSDTDLTAFPRQFARTRRFSLGVPRDFTVSPDGARVLFLRTRDGEDPVSCLWLLDADGEERLLVDPGRPAGTEEERGELPEAERVRRERAREKATGIVAYSADAAVTTVAFALDGRLWVMDVGGGRPRPVPTDGPVAAPRLDPTGSRVAYVTDGALHVTELADGTTRVLAAPENDEVTYGLPEHVAAESMHRHAGFWWAPDGRRLLVARVDEAPVGRWWIADPAHPDRPPRAIRYPAAGTANADVSLFVVPVEGGPVGPVGPVGPAGPAGPGTPDGARTEVVWDRGAFEYLVSAAWDAHGPLLSVQSRDQRTLRVLAADPDTGATETLHEQRDPAWVELVPGAPLRTASGALVHVADDGETRALTVGGRPVTPAGLQVREVLGAVGESVYVTACDEPTEEHVWRCGAGHEAVRVSEGPGLHRASPASDGTLVLASHTEDGRRFTAVRPDGTATPIASYDAEPVVTPRVTWLEAGPHGVRTALLLPSWYEEGARKLPVLMNPYSGPAMRLVLRVRGWWLCEAQWFAERGFAVVIADGRGTPGRGPAWEKTVHGDTLSPVVEDQVEALRAAAAHCPDLDLGRVAIRGWSYGGTLAAAAVLRRPDVFHAAVSGAAPSDQRLYDTHWRERFLGRPEENPEAYARSSPITEAASLTRPLLLVHGLADDNVVAAHTLRMSAALLAAGRPHRVLPLSGAAHSPTDETAVTRLLTHQLDFFREALARPVLPVRPHPFWVGSGAGAGHTFTHTLDRALLEAHVPRTARVLDYGCGYGRLTAELTELGYPDVVGIDPSAALIARGHREHPGLPLVHHAELPLPYGEGHFDAALLFVILNVIPTDAAQHALLAELARVLRPGGVLYVSEVPLQSDDFHVRRYVEHARSVREAGGSAPYGLFGTPDGGYFRHHPPEHLRAMLGAHGFEVVEERADRVSGLHGESTARLLLVARRT